MVCEKILLLHFKSGKIFVIIFLGPLLMELHFLFMNGFCAKIWIQFVERIEFQNKFSCSWKAPIPFFEHC